MEKRVNLRLEPNSKVFMSLLKSALYVLLLPMLISIALAAMFLMNMEKEAEGFRSVALEQLTGEVNQEFWSAYQLINRVKNSELIWHTGLLDRIPDSQIYEQGAGGHQSGDGLSVFSPVRNGVFRDWGGRERLFP